MADKALIWGATAVIVVFGIFLLIPKNNNATEVSDTTNTAQNNNLQGELMNKVTSYPQVSANKAVISVEGGNIELELYPDIAPKTVTNFATLAANKFYDGLTFHRVEDWVVQGGDPLGNGTGGVSIYGESFEDEIDADSELYQQGYVEGVLAMANRGPNTNSSQFFIITKDTPLSPAYTIFGRVATGMEIAKQLKVGAKIESITISN